MAAPVDAGPDLHASRCHAIVGSSWRLRDEYMQALVQSWDGPIKRLTEPKNLPEVLLGLDTPSLFEPPSLLVIRAEEAWCNRNREKFLPLVGEPVTCGALILVTPRLPKNQSFGKKLDKAGCLYEAQAPGPKEIESWLVSRLTDLDISVERPGAIASALVRHRGQEADALLAAVDMLVAYAGDDDLRQSHVEALIGGDAEQPIWVFTDAFLTGQAGKAIRVLHSGSGLEPHSALGALANELRRSIACLASKDDGEVAALIGGRRGNLYHTRKRAVGLGRRCLERLLNGVFQAQQQLRQTGRDPVLVIEMLILQAQRVIRLS